MKNKIHSVLEHQADRLDDDWLDQVDRQSRLLAWVGIIAAIVIIIIPASITIVQKLLYSLDVTIIQKIIFFFLVVFPWLLGTSVMLMAACSLIYVAFIWYRYWLWGSIA